MKKFLSVLLTVVLVCSSTLIVFAGINVNLNNTLVPFTEQTGQPFIDSASRIQVPFRATLESFGATVSWNQDTKTAIAEKDGVKVEVPIGQKYIIKNSQQITSDTVAVVQDGLTYLPIRAVLEAFGAQVSWDKTSQTVVVVTNIETTTTPAPTPTVNNSNGTVTKVDAVFAGNSSTHKYHELTCRYVEQIDADNLEYFKTAPQGYDACKVCNPN